jgi:hypothetical protein
MNSWIGKLAMSTAVRCLPPNTLLISLSPHAHTPPTPAQIARPCLSIPPATGQLARDAQRLLRPVTLLPGQGPPQHGRVEAPQAAKQVRLEGV